MGYNIDLIDNEFFIAKENKQAALEALFDMWLPEQEVNMTGGSFGAGTQERWYSWMNIAAESFRNRTIETLEEALSEWSYHPDVDDNGNITNLWFDGEKMGDEDHLFEALAPFVKAGSYLDYMGEEGSLWRWEFDGQKIRERRGRVEFEEEGRW